MASGTAIAKLYAVVGADTKEFDSSMKGVSGIIGKAGDALGALGKAAGIAAGVVSAAFVGTIAYGVKEAAAFEKNLKGIEAAFGANSKQAKLLGDYIDELSLDPTLRVSADDAASALSLLGKAGISVDEAMGGVARSAVLLANATGEEIPLAAEVSIKAMAAWGLQASDMEYVANQVTGATESSTLSLQDMFLAYSMGGGAAAAAGVEFDDFNAIIASSITLFSSGSDAGTSFKTFLDRLIPSSAEAARLMQEMGLYTGLTGAEFEKTQEKIAAVSERLAGLDPLSKTYTEDVARLNEEKRALQETLVAGSNAFFDEAGNMKSAADIAALLQSAFGSLSEEKRKEALSTIFGSDAQRTAIALMNQGAAGIENFKKIIGDTSAQERAALMTDNLSDRYDNLKESLVVLVRNIGERFLPAAERIVIWAREVLEKWQPKILGFFDEMGAQVTQLADDFIAEWPRIEKWIDNLGEGVLGFIDEFKRRWPEIKVVLENSWKEMQPVLNASLQAFKDFVNWFGSPESESPVKWAVEQVAKITGYMQVIADTMTAISELTNLSGRQINAYLRLDFGEAGRLGDEISKRMTQIKNFDANIATEIANRMAKFGYTSTGGGTAGTGGSSGGTGGGSGSWETEKKLTLANGSEYWMTQREALAHFGATKELTDWWSTAESRIRYAAMGGAAGGLTWVGERGPELVNLPYGSQVTNAIDSQRMMQQGTTINVAELIIQGGSDGIHNLADTVGYLNALYG
jgi:TP901 family phage tail tape measure protein